jgi:hypothetical protein
VRAADMAISESSAIAADRGFIRKSPSRMQVILRTRAGSPLVKHPS